MSIFNRKQIVITKQRAAATEKKDVVRAAVNSTFHLDGDIGLSEIAVNLVGENGVDIVTAYDSNGNAIVLDSTHTSLTMNGRASLQFVKPITANPVGLIWVR
ncbi:hypothetical protein KAR91_35320 [Candidatus Pacearchaeota archaeon]|nr:hypothetical protein [Candidatus Pacearchaeota archaeon]